MASQFLTVPLTLKQAQEFVTAHHRHHPAPRGHRLSIGAWCAVSTAVVGVCPLARPVARGFDPTKVCEVTRLCTLADDNCCSFLYGAAARIAKEWGFEKIITYTLPEEGGTSLRAAGWVCVAKTAEKSWNTPSRPRVDSAPVCPKWRWERLLRAARI